MKVIIATEGGETGGLGHILRCSAIAQALEEKGITPEFVINGDESLKKMLSFGNYRIENWITKEQEFFESAKDADVVIVDSYLGGIAFYEKLARSVKVPVYIDDNKRLDYPRGVVINGGIHAEEMGYPKKDDIVYLLGNRYTPLRKLFWNADGKNIKDGIESIMVTTGGNDPHNVMPRIVKFLSSAYPDLKKNIIIGNAFKSLNEIKGAADKNTELIECPDAERMKDVMSRSDVAISSGGQTLYELARLGVPTIAFRQAENQRWNLEAWSREGFVEYAGGYDGLEEKISQGFEKLASKEERAKRSLAGMRLVDGQGAKRLGEALLAYEN